MKHFPIVSGLLGSRLFFILVFKLPRSSHVDICPSFEQKANFSDPKELLNVQNDVIKKLWNNPSPKLPCLAKKFKDEILCLSRSEDQYQRTTAFATSEWIWAYLPNLNKTKTINLCSYAQIINATVALLENNDCEFMFDAIEDVLEELQNTMLLYRNVGLKKSKCNPKCYKNIPLSEGILSSCYKDGFVYDFDKMWDLFGSEYPLSYRYIVEDLYESDNYIDRVIALLATSVLSEQMRTLETAFPHESKFQLFFSSVTGSLPKSCCKQYIDDIENLFEKMSTEAPGLIDIVKKSTGCPQCHPDVYDD